MPPRKETFAFAVFGARLVFINRLWTPETHDRKTGAPLNRPRYSVTAILPKTILPAPGQAPDPFAWMKEPALASVAKISMDLYNQHFKPRQMHPAALIWPVKDGDKPNEQGVVAEWSRGHWKIVADTGGVEYLTIEAVQGGKAMPLPAAKLGNREIVKDGDFGILNGAIALSSGTQPGLKTYLNGVVFTGSGDRIVVGNRVSTDELLAQAAAQGIPVTGVGAGMAQPGELPPLAGPAASAGAAAPAAGGNPFAAGGRFGNDPPF